MLSIKTNDVLAYTTLPRVVPRVKSLFFSGFGYIAFLMAQVYFMARLLPVGHPYLDPKNIGRFGIRHVVIEAANKLTFSRKNIDQAVIFFTVLSAIVILFIQIALVIYTIFVGQVFAGSLMFDIDDPSADIAFQILDRVFGIPNMFCSSATAANCTATNPTIVGTATNSPFHNALHELFRFYSTALLLIAVLIFLYFVVVVVLETATTGTPFGQRFQNVWVPIRLVMAIGLLTPLNYGLNSAQYITLYTAKYGANWATNSWILFNKTLTLHPLFGSSADPLKSRVTGQRYTMLAIPQQVDLSALIAGMSIIHACAYAYLRPDSTDDSTKESSDGEPKHYVYGDYTEAKLDSGGGRNYKIKAYLVKNVADWMKSSTVTFPIPITAADKLPRRMIESSTAITYKEAISFYFGGDIIIRFGEYLNDSSGNDVYATYEGGVKPFCGDIRIPITSLKDIDKDPDTVGGAIYMLRKYYEMVLSMWFDDLVLQKMARSYVTKQIGEGDEYINKMCGAGASAISGCGTTGFPECALPECGKSSVNAKLKTERILFYKGQADTAIRKAWGTYIAKSTDPNMEDPVIKCGWACAGVWFNKIAEINGMFIDGVRNIPKLDKYPAVMEEVRAEKAKIDNNIPEEDQFTLSVRATSGKDSPQIHIGEGASGEIIEMALNGVYKFWVEDTLNPTVSGAKSSGNPFFDVMNFFFGTEGIISMRGANYHMHPLAKLVATGKSLVDSAIKNIALSSGSALIGGIMSSYSKQGGGFGDAISKMILSTAFLGLMAGFVLFYVLPFLPFLYFFFAVGSWVKTIFEAMVGTPLWALAHLRIDGEGLPGDAASNGYFLLLDIFIRPILSIFGLIAAISIFAAQVNVLDLIWELVVNNATGFIQGKDILGIDVNASESSDLIAKANALSQRPVVDQFFFMIIYTIICYMLALSSFKLIDQIPNNILRWAGVGVSAFGDMNAEQADALGGYVSKGGMSIGQEAADALRSGSLGAGGGLGQMIKGVEKSGSA